MAYREKRELAPFDEPTPEQRKQQRFFLWLLPALVLAPNSTRIVHVLGFKASREAVLCATVVMGIVCIIGAVLSYRSARTAAARHVAELTGEVPDQKALRQ